MGMASHLGPWLLGTVKNSSASVSTTNASQGLNRNMGATVVNQSASVSYPTTTGNICVIPAGAQITDIKFVTTATFTTSGTMKVTLGSTDLTGTAASVASIGAPVNLLVPSTAAAATLITNVGTTDQVLSFTATYGATAGGGTFIVNYVVRNSDGSTAPTPSQA